MIMMRVGQDGNWPSHGPSVGSVDWCNPSGRRASERMSHAFCHGSSTLRNLYPNVQVKGRLGEGNSVVSRRNSMCVRGGCGRKDFPVTASRW